MSSVSRLRVVSLDVTNTLIKVSGSSGQQYSRVARKFGIQIDEELLNSIWLQKYRNFNSAYPNFGSRMGMPARVWWSQLVKECFRYADSSLDDLVLDKVADDLFAHFTTASAWEFLPGALDAIKDLRRYPVKMAAISNFDDRLHQVLKSLHLETFFDVIVPSYNVGVWKPDPAIFLLALEEAGCNPEEAVHFGDNYEKDFMGARDAGMDSYMLTTTGSEGSDSSMAHHSCVVPNIQSFVDAIRPRLGQPSDSVPGQ